MKLDQLLQRITVIFLTLLLMGGTNALFAQERAGASSSPQLTIPLGAQYLNGSGAAAGVSGVESMLWNPAGLDRGEGDVEVMASRREHLADIGVSYLGIALRFENVGTFGLNVRNFDIGEIKETNEFNPGGTGGTFEPTFVTIGASYGLSITDKIGVGVTTNVTRESIANMQGTNITLDAGVQYRNFLTFEGLNIGASVRNIGTSMEYGGSGLLNSADAEGSNRPPSEFQVVTADADIPTSVDLSVEYNAWRGLYLQGTFSENTYKPSEVQGQVAYNFRDIVTVRASYAQITEDRPGDLEGAFESRPKFGATLNLEKAIGLDVSFDYGFVSTQYFSNNHILSLRGSF
ncbi:MAG: hypothetical protein BRD30_07795 [Bacteroidetes bacterium QH_2_63_10]|nr:MAG: hypothetical protein BRD30_07795 [Bacteroidetes bacterium QH_2_63_10]